MDGATKQLYHALNRGPAFLFLGQNYLKLESGEDAFLSEVIRKYGNKTDGVLSYHNILEGDAKDSPADSLTWMHGRCERFSLPDWLSIVSQFAWNGIYTSTIDVIWPKVFRNEWRELQPIFDEKYNPSDPRNRFNLHCTFLFGRVDRIEDLERVPLLKREWLKRKQVALGLIRRLPEHVTPLGVLVIEGYDGSHDWLSLEDLLSTVVDELNLNQTHIFSVDGGIENDEYAAQLIREKKLILHEESLATFLLKGEELGLIQLGQRPLEKKYGRRIQIDNLSLTIPTYLWNQVSRSAIILDDLVFFQPQQLSPDARYREFRKFLSESGTIPVWSGYVREFAFQRNFEEELWKHTQKKLSEKILHDEPIVVHGQTGTGKTIALGQLAYKIRREEKYPVLFIEGKSKNPINSDIDAFCQWIKIEWERTEKSGTPSILIIWDGNDIDQYYGLLQYLVGRGHRVVLVGSSYKLTSTSRLVAIEAPAKLNVNEIEKFKEFLNAFESTLGDLLYKYTPIMDDSFLVALYRLLPDTRSLIQKGIIKEYDKVESNLTRISPTEEDNQVEESDIYKTTLYYALKEAGLIKDRLKITLERAEIGGEQVTEAKRLLGLVMVPGSLGLRIPFELLLRTLSKNNLNFFIDKLSQFDIFHWYEDNIGNITIGPRQTLEAKLWARANIGGPKYEVDYATCLIFEIKDTGSILDNNEVQFAVDLVRNMGPNSRESTIRFNSFYKQISDTLKQLREQRKIINPRLMLQEVTLLREYVINQQSQVEIQPEESKKLIDEAESTIQHAIELLGDDPKNRSIFLGELAAIIGTKFRHAVEYTSDPNLIIELFEKAYSIAMQAWSTDTENYIPLDILSWTTRDFLKLNNMPSYKRLEAEANILHAFDMAEMEEFGAISEEKFQKRRYQIGQILSNKELSNDAFEKMKSMGSTAGYYLVAHNIAMNVPINEPLNSVQQQISTKAAQYLEENRTQIKKDGRALYLLLKLWWMSKSSQPMFYGERQSLPFTQDDWLYCYKIIKDLIATEELVYTNPRLTYLYGLTVFHLNEIKESLQIFKQLERVSDYKTGRRRIIKSYLASLPNGQPRKFSGEVSWVTNDGLKGEIFIPEIRTSIPFFPRDFNRPDIKRGEALVEFHLAFNFLGPTADPVSHLRPYRGKK